MARTERRIAFSLGLRARLTQRDARDFINSATAPGDFDDDITFNTSLPEKERYSKISDFLSDDIIDH